MKKFLIVAAMMLLGLQVHAQVSAEAGFMHGFEHWKGDAMNGNPSLDGFYAGARYDLNLEDWLDGLAFRPGLNLSVLFGNTVIENWRSSEVAINLPLSAVYNFDISDAIRLFALFGPDVQFGLVNGVNPRGSGNYYSMYHEGNSSGLGYRNRINLYLDFGVGVEAGEHVRVNIGFAVGLLNMSATKGYKVTRNALTIGAAYLF